MEAETIDTQKANIKEILKMFNKNVKKIQAKKE